MSAELITTTILAVITILAGMWQARRRELRARERASHDVELLTALPVDSAMRDELRHHIDLTIKKMIEEDGRHWDPFSVALASVMAVVGVALFVAAGVNGGIWWWLALPASLILLLSTGGLSKEKEPAVEVSSCETGHGMPEER